MRQSQTSPGTQQDRNILRDLPYMIHQYAKTRKGEAEQWLAQERSIQDNLLRKRLQVYRGESSLCWRENLLSKKLVCQPTGWWLPGSDGANIFISILEFDQKLGGRISPGGWWWVASEIFRLFVRVMLISPATKQRLSN